MKAGLMFRKEKTKQKPLTYEEKYLLEEIAMTKNAIETAYSNFENAVEPDLLYLSAQFRTKKIQVLNRTCQSSPVP